jgi:hypothetical protein
VCGLYLHNNYFLLSAADIEPIKRFLIGDGREIGYSFQHPKFGQYFRNDYFRSGRRALDADDAIKEWSKSAVVAINSALLQPTEIPLYVLHYYPSHLLRTMDDPDSMQLLLTEGWQRAWFEHDGGYARYETDIAALMAAFQVVKGLAPDSRFRLRARCALFLSSIKALGAKTPVALLTRLVRVGKLSSRQALHRICLWDHSLEYALPRLFDVADQSVQAEILRAMDGIVGDDNRARGFGALAARLTDHRRIQFAERALFEVAKIRDEQSKASTLSSIAKDLLKRNAFGHNHPVVAAATAISDNLARADALAVIAGEMDGPGRLDLMRQALHSLQEALPLGERAANRFESAAAILFSSIPPELIESALELIESMPDGNRKCEVFLSISKQLPRTFVDRAFRMLKSLSFPDISILAQVAVVFAYNFPSECLPQVLIIIKQMDDDLARQLAVGCLIELLPESQRVEALERALSAIRTISGLRNNMFRDLIKKFSETLPGAFFDAVFDATLSLRDDGIICMDILGVLAPRLPLHLFDRALSIGIDIENNYWRCAALRSLTKHLPEQYLARVLDATEKVIPSSSANGVIEELAEVLPEQYLSKALLVTEGISDYIAQAIVVSSFATNLKEPSRAQLANEVFHLPFSNCDGSQISQGVLAISMRLPEYVLQILTLTELIKDHSAKSFALIGLLRECGSILSETECASLLGRLRDMAERRIGDELRSPTEVFYQVRLITTLAEHTIGPLRTVLWERAIAAVEQVRDGWEQSEVIRILSRSVPTEFVAKLASAAERIQDTKVQIVALSAVVGKMSEPHRGELLERIMNALRTIEDDWRKCNCLVEVSKLLNDDGLLNAATIAEDIKDAWPKAKALLSIAGRISSNRRQTILSRVFSITDGAVEISPFNKVVLCLQEPDRSIVLDWLLGLIGEPGPDNRGPIPSGDNIWIDRFWFFWGWDDGSEDDTRVEKLSVELTNRLLLYAKGIKSDVLRGNGLAILIKYGSVQNERDWILQWPSYMASMGRPAALQLLSLCSNKLEVIGDPEQINNSLVQSIQEACVRWK